MRDVVDRIVRSDAAGGNGRDGGNGGGGGLGGEGKVGGDGICPAHMTNPA